MKRTLVACAAILIACAPLVGPAYSQTQVINMQNADIRAFIQDVAQVTGRTIVVDPRVQGTVTISNDRPMSRDQLFEVMLSTLRANGLVAIPTGSNTYRVVPDEVAATQPSSLGGARTGFTTQVVSLNSINAADAAEVLGPLVGRTGSLQAAPGNILIIADYADNIARIRALLAQIDLDRSALRTITLKNSSAREIAAVVSQLIATAGPNGAATPNARITMAAVESSNSIVMRGDPALVAQVETIIADLDRRSESTADVQVVRLANASADDILPVLQQLLGQSSTAGPPSTAAGAAPAPASAAIASAAPGRRQANIALFESGNALVISADPETQRVLADVIRQLDIRREQVLVEAIVVEISDSLAEKLGVQLGLGGAAGGVTTSFPNGAPSLLGVVAAAAAQNNLAVGDDLRDALTNSVANSLGSGTGLLSGFGGQAGDVVFGAIINAVRSDSASNILSTPSIVTLDNEEARLSVGQEVPVTIGEVLGANNANPFRTIERRDVGVQLEVKPQINAGGGITLYLRQEVSSVAGPAISGSSELAFNKREFHTTVLVDDGDIVVLGGLLDQTGTQGVDRVPGLSSLPGVGGLFRSKNNLSTRRNLMVFIRPTIVHTRADAQAITARSYDFMRAQEMLSRQDAKSALEAVVRDYLNASPPVAPAP